MNIKDVHDLFLLIYNKEQNADMTHEQIDSLLHAEQITMMNGMYEMYRKNKRLDDALSPFKEVYSFVDGNTASGVITIPAGYFGILSLMVSQYDNDLARNVYSSVEVVDEEELIDRLESQVVPVSVDDPIAIMSKDRKIQLFPEEPATGKLRYLRNPAAPVFAYSSSGRTISYDGNNSTQLEWGDRDIIKIIYNALVTAGVRNMSPDLMQMAQAKYSMEVKP